MAFAIKYGYHKRYTLAVNNFSTKQVCEDHYFDDIEYKNGNWIYSGQGISSTNISLIDYAYDCKKPTNFLVLLLESPHKYEYLTKPPIPARGVTGRNIDKYLIDLLNDTNKSNKKNIQPANGIYKVAIVESVNYQASEGHTIGNGTIRDINWLHYFKYGHSRNLRKKKLFYIKLCQ